MQIDERIKHEEFQIKETIDEDGKKQSMPHFHTFKSRKSNNDHIIHLYARKQGGAQYRSRCAWIRKGREMY